MDLQAQPSTAAEKSIKISKFHRPQCHVNKHDTDLDRHDARPGQSAEVILAGRLEEKEGDKINRDVLEAHTSTMLKRCKQNLRLESPILGFISIKILNGA